MKKTILMSALAFAISLGAVSCKKEKKEEVSPEQTEVVDTQEAPVEVNTVDAEILQKAEDAVKDFPTVKVEDIDGVLTLTGDVSGTQARKIKESIDALKIGEYTNSLNVK